MAQQVDTKNWYDFVPPSRWFLLTPSLWAFVAGGVMSTAVNFFTTVVFDQQGPPLLWLSILLLVLSAIGFSALSLVLEECRARAGLADLIYEIKDKKRILSSWFIISAISAIGGLSILFF